MHIADKQMCYLLLYIECMNMIVCTHLYIFIVCFPVFNGIRSYCFIHFIIVYNVYIISMYYFIGIVN